MPRQAQIAVDNQFVGGLKTDFTGLNYPPNSCTETYDCIFDKSGLVSRRLGMDYQLGHALTEHSRISRAVNLYYWKNASKDGKVSIVVVQLGQDLLFYRSSDAKLVFPISDTKLIKEINLVTAGGIPGVAFPHDSECQFAEGDGFLFVFNPHMDPVYIEYTGTPSNEVVATRITIEIRDTIGVTEIDPDTGEPFPDSYRPPAADTLTAAHRYNLSNQGWGVMWSAASASPITTAVIPVDVVITLTGDLPLDLPIHKGDRIRGIEPLTMDESGFIAIVNSYNPNTGSLDLHLTEVKGTVISSSQWNLFPEPNAIIPWRDQIGNYPSNADVWWYYKDENGDFNPADTIASVSPPSAPAPKGFWVLKAFQQQRLKDIGGIPDVISIRRPSTGAWFAGRVWYAGVNDKFSDPPEFPHIPFTENVYFSQIIERVNQFGKCYQVNDPTSEERFDLLPSDGGVIVIQGTGIVHKLFAITNGLLVFAERGIWFITGSQGIGFTANDYTVTKVSSIGSISASSFVDVQGFPMWWNEDGIYAISLAEGGFQVKEMSAEVGISNFYADIPLNSRLHAKGYFNPVEFKIQWLYRHQNEDFGGTVFPNPTVRHQYTRILNLDTQTGAVYPWTISQDLNNLNVPTVNGIIAEGGKGGEQSPPFTFKYLTSVYKPTPNTHDITFAELIDPNYVDWRIWASEPMDYTSYLDIAYRVPSQGLKNAELPYVKVYAHESSVINLQAKWDWTTSGRTGRWSSKQFLNFDNKDYKGISTDTHTLGLGTKTFSLVNTIPVLVGDRVKIYNPLNEFSLYMLGTVTIYTGTSITVEIDEAFGNVPRAGWVIHPEPLEKHYVGRRVRIRGNGQAVQLRFESEPTRPMNLIGWSTLVSVSGSMD